MVRDELHDFDELSDDELVERYQQMKTEGSGDDPRFVAADQGRKDALEHELVRRGLAPDREDLIPPADVEQDEAPTVRDTA